MPERQSLVIILLLVALCTAALVTEWLRLIDEALAEQEALKKCREWNEWLQSLLSTHSCVYVHTQLIARSFLKINPLLVLISLVTRVLLAPLELISGSLGRSFVALTHPLPLVWQFLVFLLAFALLLVVLLFKCGYCVRMLGGVIDVSPASTATYHRQNNTAVCGGSTQNHHPKDSTEWHRQEVFVQQRNHRNVPPVASNPRPGSGKGILLKKSAAVSALDSAGSRKMTKHVYLGNVKNEQVRIRKKS